MKTITELAMGKFYNILKYFIITLLLFILKSCCSTKITKQTKESLEYKFSIIYDWAGSRPIIKKNRLFNSDVYIFSAKYRMSHCGGENNRICYEPTIEDIYKAEELLKIDNRENYNKRQYIGYYSEKGDKILLVNFLSLTTICDKNSENYYLLDKVFLEILHANTNNYIQEVLIINE